RFGEVADRAQERLEGTQSRRAGCALRVDANYQVPVVPLRSARPQAEVAWDYLGPDTANAATIASSLDFLSYAESIVPVSVLRAKRKLKRVQPPSPGAKTTEPA